MTPRSTLGLPARVRACLFDLDGVLTSTAEVHAAAWKQAFDRFLRARAQTGGEPFVPFELEDYERYVDGKPRDDGTRSFLAARGIHLPEGSSDDSPASETVHGLGNHKNELLLQLLREKPAASYPGSVRYLRTVRQNGLRTAIVSSSTNCHAVLRSAGIADLFDVAIDGLIAAKRHLSGKPAPDTYLAAARALDLPAEQAAVFEDALAGVEAGRAGRFCYVVGVDRVGQATELLRHGADVVVRDLAELLGDD